MSNSGGIPLEDEKLSEWREKIAEALVGRRDASWKEWAMEWVVPHLYVDKGKEKLSGEEQRRILKEIEDRFSYRLQSILDEVEEGILDDEGVAERMAEAEKVRKAELVEWGVIEDEEEEEEEPSVVTEGSKPKRRRKEKKGKNIAETSAQGKESGKKVRKRK